MGANGSKILFSNVTAASVSTSVVELPLVGGGVVVVLLEVVGNSLLMVNFDLPSSGFLYFLATQFLKYSSLLIAPNTSLLTFLSSSVSSSSGSLVVGNSVVVGVTSSDVTLVLTDYK